MSRPDIGSLPNGMWAARNAASTIDFGSPSPDTFSPSGTAFMPLSRMVPARSIELNGNPALSNAAIKSFANALISRSGLGAANIDSNIFLPDSALTSSFTCSGVRRLSTRGARTFSNSRRSPAASFSKVAVRSLASAAAFSKPAARSLALPAASLAFPASAYAAPACAFASPVARSFAEIRSLANCSLAVPIAIAPIVPIRTAAAPAMSITFDQANRVFARDSVTVSISTFTVLCFAAICWLSIIAIMVAVWVAVRRRVK